MKPRHLLAILTAAALSASCSLASGPATDPASSGSSAQALLEEFFQPASLEHALTFTLADTMGLEGVQVSYPGETIQVAFEMPDGLSTGQSMLLFTTILDLAARYVTRADGDITLGHLGDQTRGLRHRARFR